MEIGNGLRHTLCEYILACSDSVIISQKYQGYTLWLVAKCVAEVSGKEEARRDRSEEERVGVNKGWGRDKKE